MNPAIAIIVLLSLFFATFLGRGSELSDAAIAGAGEAAVLVISLSGGLVFWSGLMRVADKAGVCDFLSRLISPLIKKIFPRLKAGTRAVKLIGMNISANLLGLGNAATPLGIEAMKELSKESSDKSIATDEMVLLAVLNSSSLQLLPTTLAVLRRRHGCGNPMDVLPAVLCCSLLSVTAGLAAAKFISYLNERKKKR